MSEVEAQGGMPKEPEMSATEAAVILEHPEGHTDEQLAEARGVMAGFGARLQLRQWMVGQAAEQDAAQEHDRQQGAVDRAFTDVVEQVDKDETNGDHNGTSN